MITMLRRLFWLGLLGGAVYAGWTLWQRQTAAPPAASPEWPPMPPAGPAEARAESGSHSTSSDGASTVDDMADASADLPTGSAPSDDATGAPTATRAQTFAAVDGATRDLPDAATPDDTAEIVDAVPTATAPDSAAEPAASQSVRRRWVDPLPDGNCPDGYPIKGNDNSGIYHVPGGRFYDRTSAERCYASAEDAEADGYRAAKA